MRFKLRLQKKKKNEVFLFDFKCKLIRCVIKDHGVEMTNTMGVPCILSGNMYSNFARSLFARINILAV